MLVLHNTRLIATKGLTSTHLLIVYTYLLLPLIWCKLLLPRVKRNIIKPPVRGTDYTSSSSQTFVTNSRIHQSLRLLITPMTMIYFAKFASQSSITLILPFSQHTKLERPWELHKVTLNERQTQIGTTAVNGSKSQGKLQLRTLNLYALPADWLKVCVSINFINRFRINLHAT